MNSLRAMFAKACEQRGQVMTEYALVLSAVAVASFLAYELLGDKITTLIREVAAWL